MKRVSFWLFSLDLRIITALFSSTPAPALRGSGVIFIITYLAIIFGKIEK